MNVFDLAASLTLDKKNYEDGLNQAEGKAESSGNKIGNTFAKVGKVAVAGFAAVGTATATAMTMFVKSTGKVAEYGDNIDKMSQKMGISAQAYQEWDAIMQHSGTSIDSMSRGMQTLQKNAVNSAEKFEALGISQEQLANMSTEELFSATITGLQNMGEGAERTALASELLGGSAKELGALLNTSAEDTEAMRQKVHELGGVMSDEAVKAAAAYQDSLQDMQTGFESLKRNLLADFMPSLTTVMNGLTDIFSGNYDEGLDKLSDGITKAVDEISSKLPKIMEVGGKIIETLATAIIDNLPALIKAAVPIIMELVTGLIENLPKIVEAAIMLITTLAQGLVDALPKLIPAIVETITKIVEILTEPDTLVQLIMAAVQIMIAIAEGLIQAIPILIKAVPQIISNLVGAIVELLPLLLNAGVQIVDSLGKGLVGQIGHVGKAMAKVGKAIINGIKHLPKEMLNWGKDMIQKFASGVSNMAGNVRSAIKGIISTVVNFFKDLPSQALRWGKDMISNFVNGIKSMIGAVGNAVRSVGNKIRGLIGFSEPTDPTSPLYNFHTFAPDMMHLFAQGVEDNAAMVKNKVNKAFDFSSALPGQSELNINGSKTGNGLLGGSFVFNIYGAEGQDANEIAHTVADIINTDVLRGRRAYGYAGV